MEAGLIARADDRGEPVIQIAPPLICDAGQLDEVVDALAEVLTAACDHVGLGSHAARRISGSGEAAGRSSART